MYKIKKLSDFKEFVKKESAGKFLLNDFDNHFKISKGLTSRKLTGERTLKFSEFIDIVTLIGYDIVLEDKKEK